jgi:hypothetical protein
MSLPELPEHLCWHVTMDGDKVTVGLYNQNPANGKPSGQGIRSHSFNAREIYHELTFVQTVERTAAMVLDDYESRSKRRTWLYRNFSPIGVDL